MVSSWTSLRSLYFSFSFCRRGNSSRHPPHQEAQKLRRVTLPFRSARLQGVPPKSGSSNEGRGSLAFANVRREGAARAAARCPYPVEQRFSILAVSYQSFSPIAP